MTEDPAARQEPVPSHGGAMSAHLGLILHVTTNHFDPGPYFSDPSHQASSTWWISDQGALYEYVDADLRAWAQADGNSTYNSVETSGTPDQPLTPAQVETCAQLYAWGARQFGWPLQLAEQPGERGFGWHGMGGQAWGGHFSCPGDPRKAQRHGILERAAAIMAHNEPAKPPATTGAASAPYGRTPGGDRVLGVHNPPLTGQDVVNVQHALAADGLASTDEVGVYSVDTSAKIARFQHVRGIAERGVGPQTWAALRKVVHG